MSGFVLKLCPLFTEDDEVHICESCSVAHHQVCWKESGVCGNKRCPTHHKH